MTLSSNPWALGGSFIVFLVLLILQATEKRWNKDDVRVPDVALGLILTWPRRFSSGTWCGIWFGLSVVLGIVLPFEAENNLNWFGEESGILITFTYTLLVPILLLAYIELARTALAFFNNGELKKVGFEFSDRTVELIRATAGMKLFLMRLVLLVLGVLVTYLGISSATEVVSHSNYQTFCHKTPWVVVGNGDCRLGLVGLIYHVVLRGLNAYLALGLMMLTMCVFIVLHFGSKVETEGQEFDVSFDNRLSVERLVVRLSLCALAGPAVLFCHGIALFFAAEEVYAEADVVPKLLEWGWIYWMSASVVSTYFLLASAIWLFVRVRNADRKTVERMLCEVEKMYLKGDQSLASYSSKIEARLKVERYISTVGRARILNFSFFVGFLSMALQIGGLMVSLYTIARD